MKLRRIVVALILAALLTVVLYSIAHAIYQRNSYSLEWLEYKIQPGDSLWYIASIYCPPERDIREWIYLIRERNDLDPARLEVGRRIEVPVVDR